MFAAAPLANGHRRIDTEQIVRGSKLLGELRDLLRRKHYSIRTEQAYLDWAKRYILFHGKRLPTVFDRSEVERLFAHLEGTHRLIAALLYGAGLRLLEGLRLRIQDLEFNRSQIIVRNGKGAKDRVTLLPQALA